MTQHASYKLISGDSHIFEPPDLWQKWIETKFRDRAPHVVEEEDTDQWYVDGDIKFGTFNLGNAGLRFEQAHEMRHEGRYDNVRKGGMDPDAHVKDMDADGIAAGVLYPSQALVIYSFVPDSQLLSAIFRGYNNYMADVWIKPYPNRLKCIAMVNVDDIEEGISALSGPPLHQNTAARAEIKPVS